MQCPVNDTLIISIKLVASVKKIALLIVCKSRISKKWTPTYIAQCN